MDHLDVYFDDMMRHIVFSQGNVHAATESTPTLPVTTSVSELPESMAPESIEVSDIGSTIIF